MIGDDLVFLSLGSNQGDRQETLKRAIALLSRPPLSMVSITPFVETEPWGFQSPNPFLNTAVAIRTELSPLALLAHTQEIEKAMGRDHKTIQQQYKDRTIDIDLLLYKGEIVQDEMLSVPHALMDRRSFVLLPLRMIAADIVHPILQKTISELAQNLGL